MINHTYGVTNYRGEFFDCSNSERGAKNYATKHGHKKVYIRYKNGYNIDLISEKIKGKWINK